MDQYDPLLLSRRVRRALADGESEADLRSAVYSHPLHGVVRPRYISHDDVTMRMSDAVALLGPNQALGGWAALRAQGNHWFSGESGDGAPRPVPVHCDVGQLRRRNGIEPWRGRLHPDETVDLGSYRATSIARAVFDEMRRARSLRDAVAMADMACSTTAGTPHCSLVALQQVVAAHPKVRGVVRARAATALAVTRSASPEETRTRLAASLDAEISGLRANVPVFTRNGRLIGIADLLQAEHGLVIESDGAHHREEGQHASDNVREEDFENHGLVVCRVTHLDHRDRWGLAARLVAADRRARQGDQQGRWTTDPPPWWSTWAPARRWQ